MLTFRTVLGAVSCAALLGAPRGVAAQAADHAHPGSSAAMPRYPVRPTNMPEAEEVSLALSAAPDEVSSGADVYVLRGTEFVKVRTGTNGTACMVGRDLHEGSRYPLCFDQEGVRSLMIQEMRETTLRAKGLSEDEIGKQVAAALSSGDIPKPTRPTLAYMMSPRQVLFSTPDSSGRRVGAWHPHIMMGGLRMTRDQLGIKDGSQYAVLQAGGEGLHEFVVLLPVWSDGTTAPAPKTVH